MGSLLGANDRYVRLRDRVRSDLGESLTGSLDATSEMAFGVFVTLVWVPVESFFLAMWGATPARALLRMRVVLLDSGNRMTYGQAFGRSANVWVRGIGVGIPVITFITMIFSRITDSPAVGFGLRGMRPRTRPCCTEDWSCARVLGDPHLDDRHRIDRSRVV